MTDLTGANMDIVPISDEAISDSGGDLLGQIQRRQINAYIAKERGALAAVSTDEVAWMAYPPTPDDDPADYAPYWTRLTDAVPDEDQCEAIVASWLNHNRT